MCGLWAIFLLVERLPPLPTSAWPLQSPRSQSGLDVALWNPHLGTVTAHLRDGAGSPAVNALSLASPPSWDIPIGQGEQWFWWPLSHCPQLDCLQKGLSTCHSPWGAPCLVGGGGLPGGVLCAFPRSAYAGTGPEAPEVEAVLEAGPQGWDRWGCGRGSGSCGLPSLARAG